MANKTPGVYIVEESAFPNTVVAVATAVPVFIGYTQKAMHNDKPLLHQPTKISSLTEYTALFGQAFNPKFKIIEAPAATNEEIFLLNGKKMQVIINDNNSFYLYHCIRLFYQNGGGNCYILSVGTYADKPNGFEMDTADFIGNSKKPDVFAILEKEYEPTLIVIPDLMAKGIAAYSVYQAALQHCAKMQNRFGIFDVWQSNTQNPEDDIQQFRDGIGENFLNYCAAYYPWLQTSVVQDTEIDFTNLDESAGLENLLPETPAKMIAADIKFLTPEILNTKRVGIHQSLMACSAAYSGIMQAIKAKLNCLPPAAAMAGIYTLVDNSRGVWKSPANIAVAGVIKPALAISDTQQAGLNIDAVTGKSINAIRYFNGEGTLVWGARTLDGNSQDWRYINVRRTLIMIEQSLQLAARVYVFEPNHSNTWITMKSMMANFLTGLWKQGAFAGATPQDAFSVQLGLGETMTGDDILNNILRVTVMVAVSHPAEFIEISFQQQQS